VLVHSERKAGWKNPKHQAQWLSTLEQFAFPKLGDLPVDKVDASAVIRTLLPIWLQVPETARRLRQRILAVLNWSHAHGFREAEAPVRAVGAGLPRQPKRTGRFAAMPYPDLPEFFATLAGAQQTMGRLALQFTILTAARSGEVRGALWAEFDRKSALWTIPGARMKAGEEHVVPLPDSALAILGVIETARSADVVFPGVRGGPLSDATLSKILREMGLKYTVHGFRSSFRDWAAETMPIPGEVAEAALAHAVANKVEAAYRRTKFLDQRRKLMAAWSDFVCSRIEVNGDSAARTSTLRHGLSIGAGM
jgi:integrase